MKFLQDIDAANAAAARLEAAMEAAGKRLPRVATVELSGGRSIELSELDGLVFFAGALTAMNTRQPQKVDLRSGQVVLTDGDFEQLAGLALTANWQAPAGPVKPEGAT